MIKVNMFAENVIQEPATEAFNVGSSIKHEDIHAKYENGILHVTFPKEETKKEAEEKKFVSID